MIGTGLGILQQPRQAGDEMGDIKRLFTPEFRNRLDAIIPFAPLSEPIIAKIVDKFLLQLEHQLLDKKVEAEFTPALRKYLAEKGFDPQMGARPMHRLIQEKIRKPLADELLFGKLADGGFEAAEVEYEILASRWSALASRWPSATGLPA